FPSLTATIKNSIVLAWTAAFSSQDKRNCPSPVPEVFSTFNQAASISPTFQDVLEETSIDIEPPSALITGFTLLTSKVSAISISLLQPLIVTRKKSIDTTERTAGNICL